jgi:hypothetical protein
MKVTKWNVQLARWEVEKKLQELGDVFAEHVKLTFLMRNPEEPDGSMIITSDTLPEIIKAVQKLKKDGEKS